MCLSFVSHHFDVSLSFSLSCSSLIGSSISGRNPCYCYFCCCCCCGGGGGSISLLSSSKFIRGRPKSMDRRSSHILQETSFLYT